MQRRETFYYTSHVDSNVSRPLIQSQRFYTLPPLKRPRNSCQLSTRSTSTSPLVFMSASTLLQLQTRAAHPGPKRPGSQPVQDTRRASSASSNGSMLSASSSSSRSSMDSASSATMAPQVCSRCHRSVSLDSNMPTTGGIKIGINSYYCNRCATMVGYKV